MCLPRFAVLGLVAALPLAAFAAPEEQAAGYRQLEAQAFDAALKDKDTARAETLFAQAVEAATRTAGPAHPDTGRLLALHALLLEQQNRPAAAEPLYQRAITILEAPVLALPADLATALELYAAFQSTQGRTAESEQLRERARPIRARLVREMASRGEAAASAVPAQPISKAMSAPVVLFKMEPAYSDPGRLAKLQGGVLLKVEIGAGGNVRAVELLRSLGLGLDEQAVTAILRWKFKPGTVDGKPVPVKANIEVNFRLL